MPATLKAKPWWELIVGMSGEDYHAHDGLGKSGLDRLRRSIAHYLADPASATTAMTEGSAFHCRVLELAQWGIRYAVAPEMDRRTKVGRAAWAEFQEQSEGLTVLTQEQFGRIEKMSEAVNNHPVFQSVQDDDGDAEVSVFWEETPYTQPIVCKARPDWVSGDRKILVDLKSTRDASPEGFVRSIAKFRYHVQAAWYLRGWRAATGINADFIFVAVESSPPHEVACYTLGEAELAEGWLQARRGLRKYADWQSGDVICEGYPQEVQQLTLPRWEFREE